MAMFKVSEVLQIAIRIEENGEKIYRQFSRTLEDSNVKAAFDYLAGEEIKHKKIFEEMMSKIEDYEPAESYPGEYSSYLRAYADNIIFTHENLDSKLGEVKNALTAIEFAIRREIDSMLYYLEMKNFIPKSQQDSLYKVIDEERTHYLKLTEMRREKLNS